MRCLVGAEELSVLVTSLLLSWLMCWWFCTQARLGNLTWGSSPNAKGARCRWHHDTFFSLPLPLVFGSLCSSFPADHTPVGFAWPFHTQEFTTRIDPDLAQLTHDFTLVNPSLTIHSTMSIFALLIEPDSIAGKSEIQSLIIVTSFIKRTPWKVGNCRVSKISVHPIFPLAPT
ncbi:hypothetical protein H1C71_014054 [Ictidomys tridecemlineatus]|nr:hypothetical protein H1C71_014054 [Ictidomys tridecemlineatus]KAG3292717.1 hypothetical protein H1C71_014054 [Ictidomys tridecemlineatus]KAG3292718.1 hypothetical protein H1C71_014054 [Ictidomys tridecemlineatus]KAG3292719.1 hypothetical protein H1C71_014054 [Ictidomys tridecemlineatus]